MPAWGLSFVSALLIDEVTMLSGLTPGWVKPERFTVPSDCRRRLDPDAGIACSEVEHAGCGSDSNDS
jgi:hypothetical protein